MIKIKTDLISGGDDEAGFEYIESEVSADDPGIGVQWEVRKMVWNSEDRFGQNSKPSGLLDLFLTQISVSAFPTYRSKLDRRQQMH